MTYPPGGQWQPQDPNQYPQQGQFPQQGYPQQGDYGQQGYPQQQGGHPQTGPQQTQGFPQGDYSQGGYPQTGPQQAQGYPQQGYGYPAPQPPRKKKGLIIGVVAAVVAVAAGAGITVWAVNRSDAPVSVGAENPTAAAMNLVTTLGNGDIAGLATTLVPAEATLVRDQLNESIKELERLEVLKPDTNASDVSGVEIKTEGLKFDESKARDVNDHVKITALTEGKLTINSDFSKIPLTQDFLELAFPNGEIPGPDTDTIDIAQEIKKNNHGEPIWIATVKSGDQWYPSLFYTIANYALLDADAQWPAQSIPAEGASSPNDAVKQFAQAGLDGDYEKLIKLLPPEEMGAVHDAGQAILKEAGRGKKTGAQITKLETDTSDVTGGTKVTLRELEVSVEGETYSVKRSGDCYQATGEGETHQFCTDEISQEIGGKRMKPEVKQALQNLVTGLVKNGIGVVVSESGGKWYVSPFRSFGELGLTALRSLQPDDVKALLKADF